MVGRPVRAAGRRHRRRHGSSTGPPTPSTATSRTRRAQTTLTVTARPTSRPSPPRRSTVTGTPAPGNTVYVLAPRTPTTTRDHDRATTAAGAGRLVQRRRSRSPAGTTVLNVVADRPDGATAHATRTVVFDFVPGTLLLDAPTRPATTTGRATTPIRPPATSTPGAYDIQDFQVLDDGTNIIFRVQTRDLSPTFGSPLGAQLVDVYVHDPAAAPPTPRRRPRSRSATTRSRRPAPGAG